MHNKTLRRSFFVIGLLFSLLLVVMLSSVGATEQGLTQYDFWGTNCDSVIDIQAFEAGSPINFTVTSNGEVVNSASVSGNDVAKITLFAGVRAYTVSIDYATEDQFKYAYNVAEACADGSNGPDVISVADWYQYQADLIPAHPDLDYIDADYLRALEIDLGGRVGLIEYLDQIHHYWIYYYGPDAETNYATLIPYQVDHAGESPTNEYHLYMTAHPVDMYQQYDPQAMITLAAATQTSAVNATSTAQAPVQSSPIAATLAATDVPVTEPAVLTTEEPVAVATEQAPQ